MLKGRDDVVRAVRRRFEATLPSVVCTQSAGMTPDGWPLSVALGRPSSDELAGQMDAVSRLVLVLREWQRHAGFDIIWTQRMAGGRQEIPTHIVVATADIAARMLGADTEGLLATMRARAALTHAAFPELPPADAARVLRETRTWDATDFELLLSAGQWFATHDARGLTPRQVPLAGFHGKWLDLRGRRSLVALLARRDDLGLVTTPPSVAFAYLDQDYLDAGGKRFDLHVLGDGWSLPYHPKVALIVENKDSYRYFPAFPKAVCVYGAGYAGVTHVRGLPWLADVPTLVYWGDMDTDGLQILNAYREQGLTVASMLMDIDSYRAYERYGTSMSAGKGELKAGRMRGLPLLAGGERELYELLCDPAHTGCRRIEQERIPLDVACATLHSLVGQGSRHAAHPA